MQSLSQRFADLPGVTPAFYTVGPQLFFVGVLVLALLLVLARRLPWWSPVALLLGVLASTVTLDLLPLTGLLMLVALWPATRADPR
ncbi:hypothetical protein [Micromonospora zhanjiangensis]|uniref:Uncharacterized protein n=1 Tax=Micromonospora zhanjiangensis TaxID=1522057 RepID=A0ABV8KVP4_9ACTN